jgi:hypothetical protein
MNKQLKTTIKEEDGHKMFEIVAEDVDRQYLPTKEKDRAAVTGYYKSDGHNNVFRFDPNLNILTPQEVQVNTRVWGKITPSIHFFNVTQNHHGPTLPQEGGVASLDPGYWEVDARGSIETYPTPSGIEYTITYT